MDAIEQNFMILNFINQRFTEQQKRAAVYNLYHICSSERFLDFPKFLTATIKLNKTDPIVKDVLQRTYNYAKDLLSLYQTAIRPLKQDQAQAGIYMGRIDNNGDIFTIIQAEPSIERFFNTPGQHKTLTNYELALYCSKIAELLESVCGPTATTRDASYIPEIILNSIQRPLKEATDQTRKPNGPQIALFFYYLYESKEIEKPSYKDWTGLLVNNGFNNSPQNIKNLFYAIGQERNHGYKKDPMNLKNIAFVINNMLDNHPRAKRKAQGDYESLSQENIHNSRGNNDRP
jgi:hypothetical protein